jgi:DNA-binding NarL/FixJ family response regulator
MADTLDVIIIDDDPKMCEELAELVNRFYEWGKVFVFSDVNEASIYTLNRDIGIAIFIVDVHLGRKTGFQFLDSIAERFTTAYEDTIMITGNADDDIVNACVASGVNHLLEKPIRPHAMQLAVRAIVTKYIHFAKKLVEDSLFCSACQKIFYDQ